jgi:hypothetical protein
MHISSPSGSESGSQSRIAPETFRLDPIPNTDSDPDAHTDPDADAGRSSCAGGEGHPFMTVDKELAKDSKALSCTCH